MTSSQDKIPWSHAEMSEDCEREVWDLPKACDLFRLSDPASLALCYEDKRHGSRLGLAWKGVDVSVGSALSSVEIRIQDDCGTHVFKETVTGRCFPPTRSGVMWGLEIETSDWSELVVKVTVSPVLPRPPNNADAHLVIAEASQTPQDVCFVFAGTDLKLWAAAHSLIKQSDYFRELLTEEYSESIVRSSRKSEADAKVDGEQQHRDFEDSDDETDAATIREVRQKQTATLPHKVVFVQDTAYTTYFATLVWMGSRWIRFAPLRSISTPSQTVRDMIETNPQVPAPASPKSVYRLAHLLDLRDLQDLALANIASQLTEENAATELFGDVAFAYPQIRDVVLAYALEHWSGVLASKGWKTIKELCDAQVLPIGGMYMAILLTEKLSSLGGLGHA